MGLYCETNTDERVLKLVMLCIFLSSSPSLSLSATSSSDDRNNESNACLIDFSNIKTVLSMRTEFQNAPDDSKLSSALQLLTIEDSSMKIEEEYDNNQY